MRPATPYTGENAHECAGFGRSAERHARCSAIQHRSAVGQPKKTKQDRRHRPSAGGPPSHVVGIGGSAGSLEPIEQFLGAIKTGTTMSFIVVTHRDPRSKGTMMVDILARFTDLQVCEASQGLLVERGVVYVVPSDKHLDMREGRVELRDRPDDARERTPIDSLFRAIAGDRGDRGVAVVLSGMGSDGTVGLASIKEHLGIALVQEPSSAAYDGMPRSAIATGLADVVGPPEKLAETLEAIARHPATALEGLADAPSPTVEASLAEVLAVVHAHSGNDFAQYKKSTMARRIERRMKLQRIADIPGYLELLAREPAEVDRLCGDLLIGVTRFFRDPEVFEALKKDALPPLLRGRSSTRPLRAWVAGCATGEEAYSIAILVREYWEEQGAKGPLDVLIYATDLDGAAITRARKGVYGHEIAVDVSPDRLARFFIKEEHTYRVRKEIRDMVVFATQNLVSDPPFTKLDLLCCRNVLIYLQPELQRKIMPMFLYALAPGGVLLLGMAEAVHGFEDGFSPLRGELKIWKRRQSTRGLDQGAEFPLGTVHRGRSRAAAEPSASAARSLLPDIVQRSVVDHVAPPVVVVDKSGDLLFSSQRMSRFFELPAGKATVNVFAMAREGLMLPLRAVVRRALTRNAKVVERGVHFRVGREEAVVDLTAWPLREADFEGNVLVAFSDVEPTRRKAAKTGSTAAPSDVAAELRRTKSQLVSLMEEMTRSEEALHVSNDELQTANEELQSTNEELQSTNEELTTSKEEMQSMNEELLTLNAELQSTNEQCTTANDDMRNLLDSSQIPTLFLDNGLRLKRFTEQASRIARFIPSDVGRPITDLTWNLRYDTLAKDVKEVLGTLLFKEAEVVADDGAVYTMRIHPYRTVDDRIDGVVITFVDITAQKRAASTTAREERLRVLEGTVGRWPGIAYVEDVASGRSLVVSAATAGILGYAPDVLQRANEAFWLALRPRKTRARERAATSAGAPEERQLRRQDGVLVDYNELTVVLARAADGLPTLVLHSFRKRRAAKKGP
jgi:two-component system, chemotaxis family, CheB/CheR fusion protein